MRDWWHRIPLSKLNNRFYWRVLPLLRFLNAHIPTNGQFDLDETPTNNRHPLLYSLFFSRLSKNIAFFSTIRGLVSMWIRHIHALLLQHEETVWIGTRTNGVEGNIRGEYIIVVIFEWRLRRVFCLSALIL